MTEGAAGRQGAPARAGLRWADVRVHGFPGPAPARGPAARLPLSLCGCDACDTTWQREADELEEHVFAVVSGNYRESVERRDGEPAAWYRVRFTNGSSGGSSSISTVAPERLEAAAVTLPDLPSGWRPWPLRHAGRR